jgi:hypothetical protein
MKPIQDPSDERPASATARPVSILRTADTEGLGLRADDTGDCDEPVFSFEGTLVLDQARQRWLELCEKAAQAQNTQTLLLFAEEVNRLFDADVTRA